MSVENTQRPGEVQGTNDTGGQIKAGQIYRRYALLLPQYYRYGGYGGLAAMGDMATHATKSDFRFLKLQEDWKRCPISFVQAS